MEDGAMASVPVGARARAWEVWAQFALESSVRMFVVGRRSLAPPMPSRLNFGAALLGSAVGVFAAPRGAASRAVPEAMEFRRKNGPEEWMLLRRCAATLLYRAFSETEPNYEFPSYPPWTGVPDARAALISAYGRMASEVEAVARAREDGDPTAGPDPHMAAELERAGMLLSAAETRAMFRELREREMEEMREETRDSGGPALKTPADWDVPGWRGPVRARA